MSKTMMPTPRWRRGKRRAVSPIIATILLVAITVVLASVLYILISGLGSTGSKPYSIGFGQGSPSQAGATYYDNFTMSSTSGLTTGILGFKITTASGASVPGAGAAAGTDCVVGDSVISSTTNSGCLAPTSGWYLVISSDTGTIQAIYTPTATSPWTGSTTISSSQTLSLVTGSQLAGSGDSLAAFGTGSSSVSGSVTL